MNKFPERLKDLRLEKGLSQKQLAEEIGVKQPTIARWERGEQVANIDCAIALAQFFDVSTDYLLGLID